MAYLKINLNPIARCRRKRENLMTGVFRLQFKRIIQNQTWMFSFIQTFAISHNFRHNILKLQALLYAENISFNYRFYLENTKQLKT